MLEFVEGETLAARLERGAIPLAEALPLARQIAEGLDAAHEKRIIHRDLKPANIKITPAGTIKVLDFGLAKLTEADASELGPQTVSTATRAGLILGTAAYMSPEQARGQAIDQRTDLWAFGCVLYEMLTGQPAFARSTVTDTLAAVIDQDVTWKLLPSVTPPSATKLLRRCLAKDRRQRLSDARDARLDLDDALHESTAPIVAVPSANRWRRWGVFGVAALATIAAVASASWMLRGAPSAPRTMRSTLLLGEGYQMVVQSRHQIDISPDGTKIVYAGNGRLYLRSLGEFDARPIPGTDEGAMEPQFSPDGLSLAFYAASDNTVKRIAVTGGIATTVYPALIEGISWRADGITFVSAAPGRGQGEAVILRVSPVGGHA